MLQLKMRAGKNTSRIPYTLRKSSLLVLILKTRFDAEMMEKFTEWTQNFKKC